MTSNVRLWPVVTLALVVLVAALAIFHHYGATRRLGRLAIETAENSGQLDGEVGTPISMSLFVHGHIIGNVDHGTADLEIPVHGSRGQGTLYAWEQGDRNSWRVCSLSFRSNRGTSIVIVADENSTCERE